MMMSTNKKQNVIRRKQPYENQWGQYSGKGHSKAGLLWYFQGTVKDREHNGPGREWQEARSEMPTGSAYVVLR